MSTKIINSIKEQLDSGRWTDSTGIIRYIERGEVTFQSLITAQIIKKEFLTNKKFKIDASLIFKWILNEKIKIKSLETILPEDDYAYVSFTAIIEGINKKELKFKELISRSVLSKELVQEIGFENDLILDWVLNEKISLFEISNILNEDRFKNLVNSYLVPKLNNKTISIKGLLTSGILDKNSFDKIKFDDDTIINWIEQEGIKIEDMSELISSNQYFSIKNKILDNIKLSSLFDDIKRGRLSDDEIKRYLDKKEITEKQLESNCGLNKERIAEIQGKSVEAVPPPPLPSDDLEKSLLSGRTDVFTFGVVGSGKSLFLGALFAYSHGIGKRIMEEAHQAAANYISYLTRAIKNGIPVEGTATNYAIHMPITFVNRKDHEEGSWGRKITKQKLHKLNFIEMSGEKFEDIWDTSTGFDWLSRYLVESNNKKIFFFVVDYFRHRSNLENSLNATQSEQFEYLLSVLKQKNIIKSTLSICMLITKWDLSPDQSNDAAREFIRENYIALYNTINMIKRTNPALDFVIHTFSIGDVSRINTYKYNPKNCEKIFDWLCNTSTFSLV
jgi:hypothetical protein